VQDESITIISFGLDAATAPLTGRGLILKKIISLDFS